MRLKELAAARVRYGYRRLHVLLRREGWPVNHKRTYRLYSDEGLSIRPEDAAAQAGLALPRAARTMAGRTRSGRWTSSPTSLFDGRPIRILTVVDCHTREALSIDPRASFRAFHVAEALDRLAATAAGQEPAGRQRAGVRRAHAGPVGLP